MNLATLLSKYTLLFSVALSCQPEHCDSWRLVNATELQRLDFVEASQVWCTAIGRCETLDRENGCSTLEFFDSNSLYTSVIDNVEYTTLGDAVWLEDGRTYVRLVSQQTSHDRIETLVHELGHHFRCVENFSDPKSVMYYLHGEMREPTQDDVECATTH